MPGQVIASEKKDFVSIFHVPLASFPISCKIANIIWFEKLLADNTLLIFGAFELVFCHAARGAKHEHAYQTTVVPHSFVFQMPGKSARITDILPGVQLRVFISKPLAARVRVARPFKMRFWDLLKCLVKEAVCLEIHIAGEFTAQAVLGQEGSLAQYLAAVEEITNGEMEETIEEPLEEEEMEETESGASTDRAKYLSFFRNRDADADDNTADKPGAEAFAGPAHEEEAQDLQAPQDRMPDPEAIADLVLKILHRREEERRKDAPEAAPAAAQQIPEGMIFPQTLPQPPAAMIDHAPRQTYSLYPPSKPDHAGGRLDALEGAGWSMYPPGKPDP